MDIASCAVPICHQAQIVERHAERAAHDPAMIGFAFLADLTRSSPFPHWMTQFNAVAVGHALHGGLGQEVAGPVLLGSQSAVEAGPVGQLGEQVTIVVPEPMVEGSLADVLHGLQHTNGDQLEPKVGKQVLLRAFFGRLSQHQLVPAYVLGYSASIE